MKKYWIFLSLVFIATSCQDFAEERPITIGDNTIETRAVEAADYYWYNGEKIYLTRSEKYVNVVTDGKLVKSSKAEMEANSLSRDEETKYVLPFFERGEGVEPIGTSDIFYLKLKQSEDIALLEKIAAELGVQVFKEIPDTPRWYTLSILGSKFNSSIEASNYFYETGKFEDVDPAFMFDFKPSANDPDFWRQWGMNNTSHPGIDINVIPAWNITRGAGVKVAVVDTPIESGHDDLDDNIHSLSYNANLMRTPSAAYGGNPHGTHVAGIIAAEKNGSQVMGVAYESKIVRVSHDSFFSNTMASEYASAINWAWKSTANGGAGVDVINCSWGDRDQYHNVHMELHSTILEQAIVNAMTQGRGGKGCVVVFAAGNSGQLGAIINYPGNFHNDILVAGSIEQTGIRSSFSGYGSKLDVVAPGGSIWSTVPYGSIGSNSGTSFAAPHVSGIAALVLSMNPNFTRQQVTEAIIKSANRYPAWNYEYGYGLVNALGAVGMAYLNNVSLTGPDSPYPRTYVSYSVSNIPSGVTFNNWSITPSTYTASGTTGSKLNVIFNNHGTYTVTACFRMSNGAIIELPKRIIDVPDVTPVITAELSDSWSGSRPVRFIAHSTYPTGSYQWRVNGAPAMNATSIFDTFDVWLRRYGCRLQG